MSFAVKKFLKHRMVAAGYFTKPSCIIVGAQKSGTTALYAMLAQHPAVVPPLRKEIHFFDEGRIPYPDFQTYHTYFPVPWRLNCGKMTFEASPSYLYHPNGAKRIHDYSPQMKIVVALRNPVERAYSAWNMYCKFAREGITLPWGIPETRTFDDAIGEELSKINDTSWSSNRRSYLKRGVYHEQIERYFDCFGRESIHIINYDQLKSHPEQVMKNLCAFLGIDSGYSFKIQNKNVSTYQAKIDLKSRKLLGDFYSTPNNNLYDLIGTRFNW